MSVGLTGSVEQRWEQLREAYLHVVSGGASTLPTSGLATKPLARAACVRRDPVTGALARTPSWQSGGSSLESEGTGDAGGTGAAAAGKQSSPIESAEGASQDGRIAKMPRVM